MKPNIIGISVLTPTVNSSIKLLRNLKEKNSKSLFVAGGIHASSFPDDMICAGFDFVIRGEGELTFYEITFDIFYYIYTNSIIILLLFLQK